MKGRKATTHIGSLVWPAMVRTTFSVNRPPTPERPRRMVGLVCVCVCVCVCGDDIRTKSVMKERERECVCVCDEREREKVRKKEKRKIHRQRLT